MKVKPVNHTSAYTAALLNELPPGLYPSNQTPNPPKIHYSKLTGKPVRKQKNPCKSRLSWTKAQKSRLESYYLQDSDPTFEMREMLSKELGVEPRSVQFWFQNRRSQDPQRPKHRTQQPMQVPIKKTTDPFNRFNSHLAPHQADVMNYMGYNFLEHHQYSSSSNSSNSSTQYMQQPATTTPTPVMPNNSMFESTVETNPSSNYDSMNSLYYPTPMSEPGMFNQSTGARYMYTGTGGQPRAYSPSQVAAPFDSMKHTDKVHLEANHSYNRDHHHPSSHQQDFMLDFNPVQSAATSVNNSPYVNLFTWQ